MIGIEIVRPLLHCTMELSVADLWRKRANDIDGYAILQVENVGDSPAEAVDPNHLHRFGSNKFCRYPDRFASALNASMEEVLRIEITADRTQVG